MSVITTVSHAEALKMLNRQIELNGERGTDIGFSCLNELYTHKQGGVTDWTGFPGSGKTYFVLELLIGLSEKYGKRWGLYVPDLGSDADILKKIMKMKTGKDFHDKYHHKITEAEMIKNLPWILHHFPILKKKDSKITASPEVIWGSICGYKDDGGELDGGLIDSWKNLSHTYSGREDNYLDQQLSLRNEMFESSNKHIHTIAHAVKTEVVEKATNKRRVPNANDIKGGGSWYANGKNILTVERPDRKTTAVNIHVSKVKPEEVGKEGSVIGKIYLDMYKGRYYEDLDGSRAYAFQWKDERKQYKQQTLEMAEPSPF